MAHRVGWSMKVLAVLALVGVALAATGRRQARAATTPTVFALSGSIAIAGYPPNIPAAVPVPAGATFTATVDPDTGTFRDGQLSIPWGGSIADGETHITNSAPASGTIDPTTGAVTLSVSLTVTTSYDAVGTCTVGPFPVELDSANPGGTGFATHPGQATVTQQGFATPAPVESTADPELDSPCMGDTTASSDTSATLTISDPGFPTTTTWAPTTTTVPTRTAAAATPVASSPQLTG